ncbi:uncharacterized protein LOC132066095 [Lycium ferocissimum]|uniref:uncharacterized protein LOC132066095 n=1 Tax=Lycium ferocissimum TaxID=112874 RepID=UPI0028158DFD|nr:uncharacterized protein LOC132066095 [Lycium ferocissimum]
MDKASVGEMVVQRKWAEFRESQQAVEVPESQITPFTQFVPSNITPILVSKIGRRAPICNSPYVSDFDSGHLAVQDMQNDSTATVKLPFEASITEEISFEMLCDFGQWVDIALDGVKYDTIISYVTEKFNCFTNFIEHSFNRGAPNSKKYNKLAPAFDCSHTNQGEVLHIDIIFYYLWKKGKYGRDVQVNFTTTDCLFGDKIKGIYQKFLLATNKKSVISGKHRIVDYIEGYYMHLKD